MPRSEHRGRRPPELIVDVLRERLVPIAFDDRLVFGDQPLPVVGAHLGIQRVAAILLSDFERFLERAVVEPEHDIRSEEHTSELQSLMRISYAVFCLKKKKKKQYN